MPLHYYVGAGTPYHLQKPSESMSVYLTVELRRQLEMADDHRCAYCHTSQANSGYPMVVDHVLPQSSGGLTEFANLCFSCHRCNLFKGAVTERIDPLTSNITPLFHPRRQRWADHFAWDEEGIHLIGLTATGRVTVLAHNPNHDSIRQRHLPLWG
jgi:hypothetical protein